MTQLNVRYTGNKADCVTHLNRSLNSERNPGRRTPRSKKGNGPSAGTTRRHANSGALFHSSHTWETDNTHQQTLPGYAFGYRGACFCNEGPPTRDSLCYSRSRHVCITSDDSLPPFQLVFAPFGFALQLCDTQVTCMPMHVSSADTSAISLCVESVYA